VTRIQHALDTPGQRRDRLVRTIRDERPEFLAGAFGGT
jgi:hypothetical protein